MSRGLESMPKTAPFGCIIALAVPLGIFGLTRLSRFSDAIGGGQYMAALSAGVGAFVALSLAVLLLIGHRMSRQGRVQRVFPPPPIFYVMGFLVLLNFGLSTSQTGLDRLQGLRALERTAPTVIGAALPGPVSLSGTVEAAAGDSLLRSPETSTPVVYYHHLVERRSDDDWTSVSSDSRFVPFYIDDGTGRVRVEPQRPVSIRADLGYWEVRDGLRYSEYRIEPGDTVFVLGDAVAQEEGDPGGALIVTFGRNVQQPFISRSPDSDVAQRNWAGGESILYSWFGIALLAFSILFLFGAFRWHNSVAYLAAVATMVMGALLGQSQYMLRADLEQARTQIEQHLESADRRLAALTAAGAEENRIRRIRIDAARAVDHYNASLSRMPERFLAPAWGFDPLAPIVLGEEEAREANSLREARPPTRLADWWVWIPILGGLLAGLALAHRGLRAVAVQRMIENIPSSPVQGVCYGLAEVTGVAEEGASGASTAPLSGEDACWYRYTIEEERGSGSEREWVEIHRDEPAAPFWCTDPTGRIEIQPRGAEITANHKTERVEGKKRYRERRVMPGDELYVLGFADVDPETHDRLLLRGADRSELPFIISAEPEATVLYRKGALGRWLLNGSLAGLVLSALFMLAALGAFSPAGYMAAALVGWVFLLFLVIILHYNDLVFLRHRTERNRSNIDVALKKRFELVRQMEAVVRETAAHERTLLDRMAALRSGATSDQEPSSGDETRPIRSLAITARALREAYPELQSSAAFSGLMLTLSRLEDEIALMRNGYNDAVERLNTRVQTLPDSLLARPFGFRARPFLRFETEPAELEMTQAAVAEQPLR
jgi:hypothetical protein